MVNLTQLLSVGIDAVVTVLEKWGVTGLNINFDFQASENLISRLLMWIYGWMGNYGWTIILFTVVLRLITLPLDFWQKLSMKKNSKIMEEITPIMTKIDKAYGDNVQRRHVCRCWLLWWSLSLCSAVSTTAAARSI